MALKTKKNEEEELPFPVEIVTEDEIQTDDQVETAEVTVVKQTQQLADYEILNPEIP